jgi:hypothetical protein
MVIYYGKIALPQESMGLVRSASAPFIKCLTLRFRVAMDGDHDVVSRNLDRRHQLLKFAVMQKKALRPFQARLECSEEARCFASSDGAMIESEG